MTTQKDIHNILIKADDTYKAQVIKQCDCDIEKIKNFEQLLADVVNISVETIGKAWEYMNEESNNCNLTTCRYNQSGKCTNEKKRKECVEVSKSVLCLEENDNANQRD